MSSGFTCRARGRPWRSERDSGRIRDSQSGTVYQATPGAQALHKGERVCNRDDNDTVAEDRQETRRPARRLTREAAAGEERRGGTGAGDAARAALGSPLGVGGKGGRGAQDNREVCFCLEAGREDLKKF